MLKENNGQCRENNEKLCEVKACRKIKLHYDQWEKLENKIKLYFENVSIFFLKKLTYTHARTPLPPVRFCSLFNDPPPSPPPRTYFLNDPLLSHKVTVMQIEKPPINDSFRILKVS